MIGLGLLHDCCPSVVEINGDDLDRVVGPAQVHGLLILLLNDAFLDLTRAGCYLRVPIRLLQKVHVADFGLPERVPEVDGDPMHRALLLNRVAISLAVLALPRKQVLLLLMRSSLSLHRDNRGNQLERVVCATADMTSRGFEATPVVWHVEVRTLVLALLQGVLRLHKLRRLLRALTVPDVELAICCLSKVLHKVFDHQGVISAFGMITSGIDGPS